MAKQTKKTKNPEDRKFIVLGARIRRAREALGLTVTEAAKRIGVSKAMQSYWETGRNRPEPENLHELSKLLHTPYRDLIRGTKIRDEGIMEHEAEGELIDIKKLRPDQIAILKAAIGKHEAEVWRLQSDSIDREHRSGSYLVVVTDQAAKSGDTVLLLAHGVPIFRAYLKPFGYRHTGEQQTPIEVDNINVKVAGVVTHGFPLP